MSSINIRGSHARAVVAALSIAWVAVAGEPVTEPLGEIAMTESSESRNKALVRAKFDAWRAGTGSPFDLLAGQRALDSPGASGKLNQ
jgi:hypothetical protein